MTYLPFWLGGAALAVVAVGYCLLLRRLLGVSGSFAIALGARPGASDVAPAALEAALEAATAEEFGPQSHAPEAPAPRTAPRTPLPRSAHVTLILAMIAGGTLGAISRGSFRLRPISDGLGPEFARVVSAGWPGLAALALGGALVGFGTQMAGGCTSGHGLCGTARLQRGSIAATCSFFGVAVLISLAIEWVRR